MVVLCHVALDERNGGGMRTLLSYLSRLGAREFHSVHFGDTAESGIHGLGRVGYLRVDKRPFPQSLTSYARILRKLRREIGEDATFLLLPNTKDDVQLCLAATFVSARTCVWVMDDFVTTLFPNDPRRRLIARYLFRRMYLRAGSRIAISEPMRREYARRYGKAAELVLGKRWLRADLLAGARREQPVEKAYPLRIVWVGKYQPYYDEPLGTLSKLLRARPDLPVLLDLYGQVSPPPDLLVSGRLEYRGPFADARLLATLRAYDYGLLTYSFDARTREFMRYSFPGKLTDYVSAGLPVITISPRDITVCDDIVRRNIGPCVFDPTPETLYSGLNAAIQATPVLVEEWRQNSLAWAREEFVFEVGLEQLNKLIDRGAHAKWTPHEHSA